MDIEGLFQEQDWKELARQRELAHWERKYRHAVKLCKAIRANFESIEYISKALAENDTLAASEAWFELDEQTQSLLITAPTYGGPFTTKERAQIVELWRNERKRR